MEYKKSIFICPKEKGNEKDALNYEMKLNKIKLPIKKGQEIGILKLKDGTWPTTKTFETYEEAVEYLDGLLTPAQAGE